MILHEPWGAQWTSQNCFPNIPIVVCSGLQLDWSLFYMVGMWNERALNFQLIGSFSTTRRGTHWPTQNGHISLCFYQLSNCISKFTSSLYISETNRLFDIKPTLQLGGGGFLFCGGLEFWPCTLCFFGLDTLCTFNPVLIQFGL